MELLLGLVAKGVIKTLVDTGSKLAEGKLKELHQNTSRMEEYLRKTTNQVGYFVTYRPGRQRIEDAYVEPRLIKGALVRTHLPVALYRLYAEHLSEDLKAGNPFCHDPYVIQRAFDDVNVVVEYEYVSNVVASGDSYLVLAEAGAGKTSLLSYLCFFRLKEEKPKFPVFLDSRLLGTKTLSELLAERLGYVGLSLDEGKTIGSGIALYLDGLDELSLDRYKRLCSEVRALAAEAPELCIIACCRGSAYRDELSFMKTLSLEPFDRQRTKAFVTRWFRDSGNESLGGKLLLELDKSSRLSDLSTQPLMLSLMCNAYRKYLRISRQLGTLFEQCVNALLWEWDADRDVKRDRKVDSIDLQKALWLHCRIAVYFHQARERYLPVESVVRFLTGELPKYGVPARDATKTFDDFCAGAGIIVKFTEEVSGFAHLGLQEFLTAKWYASEARWQQILRSDLASDPWWREIFVLCAASLSDATEMLERLIELPDVSEELRLSLLASCLRQGPIVEPAFSESVWRRVLNWYHNGDKEKHNAACDMLVDVDDQWTLPLLIASLGGRIPDRETAKLLKR